MAMDGSQFKFKYRFTPSEKDRNGPPPGADPRAYVPTGLWAAKCVRVSTGRVEGIGFGSTAESARNAAAEFARRMQPTWGGECPSDHSESKSLEIIHYSFAPCAKRKRIRRVRAS